jgi:uncharacterized protein RhaS with RHS repeats
MKLKTALAPIVALVSVAFVASDASAYYASHMGRWLTRDPIGYSDSANLYEYVLSQPLTYTDSSGLSTLFPGKVCNQSYDCVIIVTTDPIKGSGRTYLVLEPGECGLGEYTKDDDFVYVDDEWHKTGWDDVVVIGGSGDDSDGDGARDGGTSLVREQPGSGQRPIDPNQVTPAHDPNDAPQIEAACRAMCECNDPDDCFCVPDCIRNITPPKP